MQQTVGNRATGRLLNVQRNQTRRRAVTIHGDEEDAAITHFNELYAAKMARYPHVRADIQERVRAFQVTSRTSRIEDYSNVVFNHRSLNSALLRLNISIPRMEAATATSTRQLIGEMLLYASLVLTRGAGGAATQQFAIEVMSPNRLVEVLETMADQLDRNEPATGGRYLQDTGLAAGDSTAQRMLKLSGVNLQAEARRRLQADPLFQGILNSPHIVEWMFASSGAEEQRFLNTCASSAHNQKVLSEVTSIAGLLMIGRNLATGVEGKATAVNADPALARHPKRKAQLLALIDRRTRTARATFDRIETAATAIVTAGGPPDFGALQELTREWSRVMQKLAALADVSEGGGSVPQLTKKDVKDQWGGSAVLAVLQGKAFFRPHKRIRGIAGDAYRADLRGSSMEWAADNGAVTELQTWVNDGGATAAIKMQKFWTAVAQAGGTPFSVPGHALFMKAVMQGRDRIFLVGDPKISQFTPKTLDAMRAYAVSSHLDVPSTIITTADGIAIR